MLFGKAGAPAAMKAPARVIAPGDGRPLRVKAGALDLSGPSVASKDPSNADKTAKLSASEMANGANVLRSADGTMEVSTKLRGTLAVAAKATEGLVVYAGGHTDGDVVVRPTDDGAEDWLLLTKAPASGKVEYDLGLTKGVKAVRVVANTVEMLDDEGTPRLRMAPPEIVGDDCQRVDATVKVTGCVIDTDPSSPFGKSHPAPNAASCRVELTWDSTRVKYPAAVDPTWSSTASMSVPRAWHTATVLNGSPEQVLVAGGLTSPGYIVRATAEFYNAATNTWAAAANMGTARYAHAAAKFSDTGEVYVSGGLDSSGTPTSSVEVFKDLAWTARAALPTATSGHTMDVFASDWLYVAGGYTSIGGTLKTTASVGAYLRTANYFYPTPQLPATRAWHSSVVASDGIYLLGGERNDSTYTVLSDVIRYNPGANTLTSITSMPTARTKFAAGLVGTSPIVVAGGESTAAATAAVDTLAVSSPASWVSRPAMANGRVWGRAAMRSTRPVVTGGYEGSTVHATTTLYDSLSVALPGPTMTVGRYAHTATALSGDRVFVAGGVVSGGSSTATTEVLTPTACTTPAQCDDGNPCTVDACTSNLCTNIPSNPGTVCDDGNACNGVSQCSTTGQCVQTVAPKTDPCGTCDPVTGTVATKAAGEVCALPASACKTGGLCNGAGTSASSCIARDAAEGTPCGSTNKCTGEQVCTKSGSTTTCTTKPGLASLAVSTDACSSVSCDPGLGLVHTKVPGCGVVASDSVPVAVATSFDASTAFLTAAGSTTGQAGVVLANPARRSVVRGKVRVLDAAGAASTPAVSIAIKGHPELGTVTSGNQGEYAIVVEGGDDLVVQFSRSGFITAERHARTLWQQFTVLEDVVLVSRSATATTIQTGAAATGYQAAWGDLRGVGAVAGANRLDTDAQRKGLLLFPPGITSPNLPAGPFTVRVTELTAFADGARAMPASLPPSSGYTYAMDLAVDGQPESSSINWSAPVSYYVENFIGIPNAASVPLGYYDRTSSSWVTLPSGVVFKITGVNASGVATVDPSTAVPTAELTALGTAYKSQVCGALPSCSSAPGGGATPKSLWRVSLPHFSTYDCNWGMGAPPGAGGPPGEPPQPRPPTDGCKAAGSIIECQNQALGEELPIAGTPFALAYRSSHTEASNLTLDIPVTDANIGAITAPSRIEVDIELAGRRERIVVNPPYTASQRISWTWDRKDAFGHKVEGSVRGTTQLRYVYPARVGTTVNFAEFPQDLISANRANREIGFESRPSVFTLGTRDARGLGFGGWQLSAHGVYDPATSSLYLGDGRTLKTSGQVETFIGGGTGSHSPDGVPGKGASISTPNAIATRADGKIYWNDYGWGIRSLDVNGNLETLGGTSCAQNWPTSMADVIPASSACVSSATGMAVDPSGTLYVSDGGLHRILAFSGGVGGTARLVVGRKDGAAGTFTDGAAASASGLNSPQGLALDVEGNLVFAAKPSATSSAWIVRLGNDGALRRVAGRTDFLSPCLAPASSAPVNGMNAACFTNGFGLHVDRDGLIYVHDGTYVRVIRQTGTVDVLVGGSGGTTRAGLGTTTPVSGRGKLITRFGQLYYMDQFALQLRVLRPTGYVEEALGIFTSDTQSPETGTLTQPLRTDIGQSADLALGPEGALYVAGATPGSHGPGAPNRILKVVDGLSSLVDGDVVHDLDTGGNHWRTRSRMRGTTLRTFGYSGGLLSSVAEENGQTLGISRSPGLVTLTAPNGMQTKLTIDARGYLTKVEAPDLSSWLVQHDDKGLLVGLKDQLGRDHTFGYDARGLLTSDLSPMGQGTPQTLTSGGEVPTRVVTHVTAAGHTRIFDVDRRMTVSDPQRTELLTNTFVVGMSGSTSVTETSTSKDYGGTKRISTAADGSTETIEYSSDPKSGPIGRYATKRISTRGGLSRVEEASRVIAADDSTETTTTTVNSKTWTSLFTRSTNKIVSTSPMGRVTTTFLDAVKDRAASMQIGPASGGDPVTLYPTTYSYYGGADIKTGLVNTVSVNTRTTTYTYDASGFVASVTAPDGKVTAYNTRDALGRPTQMTLPGGRVVNMAYDAAGNATTVTTPPNSSSVNGNPHGMTYNAGDLLATYVAPDVGGAARTTTYTYDKDALLKQLLSPVDPALSKTLTRDGAGRVIEEIEGGATGRRRTFAYTSGHLTQQRGYVNGTQEVEQNFAFNTGLWTGFDQKLFTGGVKTVTRTNDTFFRLTNVALTGLTGTVDYGYDDDGLVSNVGGLVATRGTTAGLLKRLERSGLEDETFQYDSYGALTQMNALQAGVSKGGLTLTYDAASGRILTKTENWNFPSLTPALLSKTWTYTYDTSGRLASASDGGAPVTYTYDTNGNRLPTTLDAQDRVSSQSGTTYTYDNHGNATTRKVGSQPTQTLTWNGQGGLLSVVQSGSPTVTYVIDPQGRRVGRKVGANLDREWLYDTQLRLVGEVIGTTSRVYGYLPERHLPVMMRETKGGNTTTYRIYGDHLGSLRAVVKSADGTPVQLMQHDAWGNVLIDTVAANFDRVPFGFAGGQYDENTKLVRFGAREYDATTGRWLSKDEARFGGGWNFYEYADGDPVNNVDDTGMAGRPYGTPAVPDGGQSSAGGICHTVDPNTREGCDGRVKLCLDKCSGSAKQIYLACVQKYLEKDGNPREDICGRVRDALVASCPANCQRSKVCQ